MKEKEWLECTNPETMLNYLCKTRRRPSDRKLRFFACACCRRIWRSLNDKRSRKAVEVSERYADRLASEEELGEAEGEAWDAAGGEGSGSKKEAAAWAASDTEAAVWNAYDSVVGTAKNPLAELVAQAVTVHDIFGNPFRPQTENPSWLTWNDGTIPKLAEAIYQERAFDRLPILADALEEAGCHSKDILDHCRGPGPHVRGCWVLDLVMGRK